MRTTNRVRRNNNLPAARQQGHIGHEKTVEVWFDWPGPAGRECDRVNFSKSEFQSINAAAKKLGLGLDKFFELAIAEKIGKSDQAPGWGRILELESAKAQSKALLKLLADNLDYWGSNGCQFGSEEDRSMCAGIAELVGSTNARLENALNSVSFAVKKAREGEA